MAAANPSSTGREDPIRDRNENASETPHRYRETGYPIATSAVWRPGLRQTTASDLRLRPELTAMQIGRAYC